MHNNDQVKEYSAFSARMRKVIEKWRSDPAKERKSNNLCQRYFTEMSGTRSYANIEGEEHKRETLEHYLLRNMGETELLKML